MGPPPGPNADRPGPDRPGPTSPTALDPLVAINAPDKPLYSKVLAVPKYRDQFIANLKTLARESLNWSELGPLVDSQAKLIGPIVKTETRSLTTYERFQAAVGLTDIGDTDGGEDNSQPKPGLRQNDAPRGGGPPPRGPGQTIPLKTFIEGRSEFLLNYDPRS